MRSGKSGSMLPAVGAGNFGRVLCGCLFLSLTMFGQKADPASKSDADQLITLEKMWNQVQLLRDAKALDSLIGERFVGTYASGHFARKTEFLEDIKDTTVKPTAVSIQDLHVELYGDTGVVTGIYHSQGTDHGKPYDEVGRFTDTWTKQRDKWECVASHASLLKNHK